MRASRLLPLASFLLLLLLGSGAGASPGGAQVAAPIALAAIPAAASRGASPAPQETGSAPLAVSPAPNRSFPALLDPRVVAAQRSHAVPSEEEWSALDAERSSAFSILANNQILAFYGKPDSRCMGILGEYPKERLAPLLRGYAKLYDDANGDRGVVPALYLIYGTCWPGGEIGYLAERILLDYIEFAAREGMLVFVDHQIGKYGVVAAMDRLLPYLRYPNVHLALDPEWRTDAPMEEIGCVTAEELNAAQAAMRDYLEANGIPGTKMLVVHQFKPKMIAGRDRIRADYERVTLVHTADGFGSPVLKRLSYAENARAENLPIKGFKLFFKTSVTGAGFDEPLLNPQEVLALDPEPGLVMYQ